MVQCVYEIPREPLNGFAPNSQRRRICSLARKNLNVKVKGQRSRSQGQKTCSDLPSPPVGRLQRRNGPVCCMQHATMHCQREVATFGLCLVKHLCSNTVLWFRLFNVPADCHRFNSNIQTPADAKARAMWIKRHRIDRLTRVASTRQSEYSAQP